MKSHQKVILDTNVFLSGIFWSGPPYQILKAWQSKQIDLIISVEILEEYNRVFDILSSKYPPVNLTPFMDLITQEAHFFEPIKLSKQISDDPDDDKFIACALAAEADYIISGDKDLLSISGYEGIQVLKPREFSDKYLVICSL